MRLINTCDGFALVWQPVNAVCHGMGSASLMGGHWLGGTLRTG